MERIGECSKNGSISVVPKDNRESLNLRVTSELKQHVADHAEELGISLNAAAILLITEGVKAKRGR